MKKLERILKDFYASNHEFATITRDLFGQAKEAWNAEDIEKGNAQGFDYEVENLLEVMDGVNYPKDYEFLGRLYQALIDLEKWAQHNNNPPNRN